MSTDTGSVLGIISIIISVGGTIYAAINHKRIRCKCCGKNIEVQMDVDSTEASRKSGQFAVPDVKVHKPDDDSTHNQILSTRPMRVHPL